MKKKFLSTCSYFLALIGLLASGVSCVGCALFFLDEPVMPNSMIN